MLREGKAIPETAFPFVRSLNLSAGYSARESLNLKEISKLTDLRSLTINYLKNGDNLHELASLGKLRNISILLNGKARFDWLNDLTKVEVITLRGLVRPNSLFEFPERLHLEKLHSLTITNCRSDIFPNIEADNLSELIIDGFDVDSYEGISKIVNLKKLSISDLKIRNFDFLEGMHELEEIDVRGTVFEDLSVVKRLRGMRTIYLYRSTFSSRIAEQIGGRIEVRGDHGGLVRAARR